MVGDIINNNDKFFFAARLIEYRTDEGLYLDSYDKPQVPLTGSTNLVSYDKPQVPLTGSNNLVPYDKPQSPLPENILDDEGNTVVKLKDIFKPVPVVETTVKTTDIITKQPPPPISADTKPSNDIIEKEPVSEPVVESSVQKTNKDFLTQISQNKYMVIGLSLLAIGSIAYYFSNK